MQGLKCVFIAFNSIQFSNYGSFSSHNFILDRLAHYFGQRRHSSNTHQFNLDKCSNCEQLPLLKNCLCIASGKCLPYVNGLNRSLLTTAG